MVSQLKGRLYYGRTYMDGKLIENKYDLHRDAFESKNPSFKQGY